MKTIIIYHSKTGFTKRYACWLSEELACELIRYEDRSKINFEDYECVIFGSWCHAGQVLNLKWFKEQAKAHPGKHYAAFVTGASPADSPSIKECMKQNFPDDGMKGFYLPGGLNYEKMSFSSRMMMKMFSSMLKKKKNNTEEEKLMAEMLGKSYDISDRGYLDPIIQYIHNNFK